MFNGLRPTPTWWKETSGAVGPGLGWGEVILQDSHRYYDSNVTSTGDTSFTGRNEKNAFSWNFSINLGPCNFRHKTSQVYFLNAIALNFFYLCILYKGIKV